MSSPFNGVLVVDKPAGRTSHDMVAAARRLFGMRAVGHAGTLDPMATGVLVLLFGEACKLSSYLSAEDKSYQATVSFGTATDSLDADGRITESVTLPEAWLSRALLDDALVAERSRTEQVPPAVSAIQVAGERAYARARRGETVELLPRAVELKALSVLSVAGTSATFELTVSKGYYVRAFARDLGRTLGVPAHLSALRRSASGAFTLSEAVPFPRADRPALLSVHEAAKRALPTTRLSEEGVQRAQQGKRLESGQVTPGALDRVCAWLSPKGDLVALGISSTAGEHRVVRGVVPC